MRASTVAIAAAVAAVSAAPASAQTLSFAGPFAGPYLGVQGGVSANEMDFTDVFDTPTGTDTTEVEFGATGLVGGVYGGVGMSFNGVTAALEGDFSWNTAENEQTFATTVPGGVDEVSTAEFQESYGVGALLGATPFPRAMPNTMIYLRGGWQWQAVDFEDRDAVAGTTFETDETFSGPAAGAGVAVRVTPSIVVRLDYRHVFYGEEEIFAEDLGGGDAHTQTFSIDEDRVMLGLHWQFGPMIGLAPPPPS